MTIKNNVIYISILLFTLFSCNKAEDNIPKNVELLNPSSITEVSFTANWNVEKNNLKSIVLLLAYDNSFDEIIRTININDLNTSSFKVDGLYGATKYLHKLKIEYNDGTVLNSAIKTAKTTYFLESVNYNTSDNITIAAKLAFLSSNQSPKPGLIFMHEMGAFVNNWNNSDVVEGLIAKGYVCLIFSFRGHGNSSPVDDMNSLVEDKSLIAKDLVASLDYLKSREEVDPQNIGLLGGSLGAIMAVAGNGFEEVKTSVSISGVRDGIFQIFPDLIPNSVLYIVGENDIHTSPSVNFPLEAQAMFNISQDPKKIIIVPGSSAHGTNILISDEINNEVINWVDQIFIN